MATIKQVHPELNMSTYKVKGSLILDDFEDRFGKLFVKEAPCDIMRLSKKEYNDFMKSNPNYHLTERLEEMDDVNPQERRVLLWFVSKHEGKKITEQWMILNTDACDDL